MTSNHLKFLAVGAVLSVLSMILGLWAWNTLADLFNLPEAQVKHVIAATAIVLLLRWLLVPGRIPRPGHARRCTHEQ